MVEVKLGYRTVDLPYTLRVQDVTEEMFDEFVDEDTRAELLDGVMIVHSPACPRHDDVSGFLRSLMRMFAAARRLGKLLGPDSIVHLASCRKFAPDLFYFQLARVPHPLPRKQFEGSPDLVAEVLSPFNRDEDLEDKRQAYREARVQEIWVVDLAEEKVIVDRRRKRSYSTITVAKGRVLSSILPGFWIDAAWLWAEPMPNEMACLREILS